MDSSILKENPSVLIVDSDPDVQRTLRSILELGGYRPLLASTGAIALQIITEESPALMLLELMLPDTDGFSLCSRVRELSSMPIIVLSARDTEWDKVRALNLGADDYVTKPIAPRELVARIRAVLRRTHNSNQKPRESLFTSGDLKIDFDRRRVEMRERPVNLSQTEYRLLCELVRQRDKICLPGELLSRVWGPEYRNDTALLRTCVWRLRRKIELDPHHPQFIVRMAGGYMFNHSW